MALTSLPALVIYDWDNTLVDGWPAVHAAMNAAQRAFGQDLWDLETVCRRCHRPLDETFPQWFGPEWPHARTIFYETFSAQHLDHLRPLAGVENLLRFFRSRHIPQTIASSKRGDLLRAEVQFLNWQDYFAAVLGAGDTPKGKPDPTIVFRLRESVRMMDAPAWFIGDTETDYLTARNSRCESVIIGCNVDVSVIPDATHFDHATALEDFLKTMP